MMFRSRLHQVCTSKRRLSSLAGLPTSADAVVIGGGSIGCSVLYHLAKDHGINAVLLESNKLTSGTTWHSAGLLWQLAGLLGSGDVDLQLSQYTKQLVEETLPAESGEWAGWTETGSLFACTSEQRLVAHNRTRLLAMGIAGVESHILHPEEAKNIHPLMRVDDLVGAIYTPSDGHIDPSALVSSYTTCAKQLGARIYEGVSVAGIAQSGGAVSGVTTSCGQMIRTPAVINCTGAWARKLGAMAGVDLPLLAYKHAYVVTQPIDGLEGLPSIRDYDAAVYMKTSGKSLHIGGYELDPIRLQTEDGWDMQDDFAFGLYDLDYEVFGCHLESHINRVPKVADVGIQSTVCGPESFTPDHKPLMGECPSLKGFFVGCGLNSAGIMYSGGLGRALADWVVRGAPAIDIFSADITRFHPECTGTGRWLQERSHETYANQSVIPWPHDQPLGGRNVRQSPLHAELEAAGCVFIESHGYERAGFFLQGDDDRGGTAPLLDYDYYGAYGHTKHEEYGYRDRIEEICTFDTPTLWAAEHRSCREGTVVFDQSCFGKIVISGFDAVAAMEWLCSNTVSKNAGHSTYTCMLSEANDGGVLADLVVSVMETPYIAGFESDGGGMFSRCGSSFYITTGSASKTHDLAHIRSALTEGGYDCEISDESDNFAILSVQGRHSRAIIEAMTQQELNDGTMPFSTHKVLTVCDGAHVVRVARLTFVGELGYELHVEADAAVDVYTSLFETASQLGLPLANAGYKATQSLSLEKGYRHWHGDLRPTDNPFMANLGFTCKFGTDTPFLGRDALEARRAQSDRALPQRLACFTVDKSVPLHGYEPLFRDGSYCGVLREAGFGFSVDASIGYGMVARTDGGPANLDYLRAGAYAIETATNGMVPATLHTKPLFDPNGDRVKGCY